MPTPRNNPRSDSHPQRARGAVTGTLIALGVWLLSTLGFLQPLTGWAYDQFFRLPLSAGTSPPPAVVLIEWNQTRLLTKRTSIAGRSLPLRPLGPGKSSSPSCRKRLPAPFTSRPWTARTSSSGGPFSLTRMTHKALAWPIGPVRRQRKRPTALCLRRPWRTGFAGSSMPTSPWAPKPIRPWRWQRRNSSPCPTRSRGNVLRQLPRRPRQPAPCPPGGRALGPSRPGVGPGADRAYRQSQ